MTRIILHGGGSSLSREQQVLLTDEILKTLPCSDIKILIIPFARGAEQWADVFAMYQERYSALHIVGEFILALPELDILQEQIFSADVVMIAGGSEKRLEEYLSEIPFSVYRGKTVVGFSAGANIFASYYYSNDRKKREAGLYQLPFNTICHYNGSQEKEYQELMLLGETHALREGEFFVFSQK